MDHQTYEKIKQYFLDDYDNSNIPTARVNDYIASTLLMYSLVNKRIFFGRKTIRFSHDDYDDFQDCEEQMSLLNPILDKIGVKITNTKTGHGYCRHTVFISNMKRFS